MVRFWPGGSLNLGKIGLLRNTEKAEILVGKRIKGSGAGDNPPGLYPGAHVLYYLPGKNPKETIPVSFFVNISL
jgi:hypothetical protein